MNFRLFFLILILFEFLIYSCGQKSIPPEFVGQWKTETEQIMVRTKLMNGKFIFISGSAEIFLTIHSDNNADGSIGLASFENARIKKNFGNPEKKGIAIKIKCGSVGKIFENDPLENKEVELWLLPIKEEDVMEAEFRYTEGGSYFPMAGITFTRED